MIFKTKREVIDYLNLFVANNQMIEAGDVWFINTDEPYALSHGEYAEPHFKPVRYGDGWKIKAHYFFYDGTFNAPKDGPVNIFEVEEWGARYVEIEPI